MSDRWGERARRSQVRSPLLGRAGFFRFHNSRQFLRTLPVLVALPLEIFFLTPATDLSPDWRPSDGWVPLFLPLNTAQPEQHTYSRSKGSGNLVHRTADRRVAGDSWGPEYVPPTNIVDPDAA